MKFAAILFLACAVVLGPVAWTLDACADEDFDGEAAAALYADGHPNFFESEAKPAPVMHCVRHDPFGPALQEPPLEMTGSNKPAPAAASRHASGPACFDNTAGLDALFKRPLLSVHTAPYLFLSVLRI